ncbi:MAG: DUF1361 domain-containing protein [Nonlabens sp.]
MRIMSSTTINYRTYRNRSCKAILSSIAICLVMLLVRIIITSSLNYTFLIWNLFLAVLPWVISHILMSSSNLNLGTKSTIGINLFVLGVLFTVWLLLLPNAPYLITDLKHLSHNGHILYYYDLSMLLSYSLLGISLFTTSLQRMVSIIFKQPYFKKLNKIKPFAEYGLILLTAFGIFFGRSYRWNSWDLIHRPFDMVLDVATLFYHFKDYPQAWLFVLGMAILLSGCNYISHITLISPSRNR